VSLIQDQSDWLVTGGSQQATLFNVNDRYGRAHRIVAEPHSFMANTLDPKWDYH
jgi:hypothetical protein